MHGQIWLYPMAKLGGLAFAGRLPVLKCVYEPGHEITPTSSSISGKSIIYERFWKEIGL